MMKNQQTVIDLQRLFASKLHRLIEDTNDSCQRVDIANQDIVKLILLSLFYELVQGAAIANWDEEDFIVACRLAYRTIMPTLED